MHVVDTDKTYAYICILGILFQLQVAVTFPQACDTNFHALPFFWLCQTHDWINSFKVKKD